MRLTTRPGRLPVGEADSDREPSCVRHFLPCRAARSGFLLLAQGGGETERLPPPTLRARLGVRGASVRLALPAKGQLAEESAQGREARRPIPLLNGTTCYPVNRQRGLLLRQVQSKRPPGSLIPDPYTHTQVCKPPFCLAWAGHEERRTAEAPSPSPVAGPFDQPTAGEQPPCKGWAILCTLVWD